jgi:putative ABC transport system permease protein
MLRNYISVALRSLFKNRIFSILNILGLAIGMAAFLFIVQYIRFERSYESFHTHADDIYRVTLDLYNGNEYVVTDCETYAPLGPILKAKQPEVIDYVRMFHNDGFQDVEIDNRRFLEEGIYFADASVFTVFTLQALQGNVKTALIEPYKIALSETTAKKYFGRTDVVGESLKLSNQIYHVTAVFADLPPNTHLKYNALLSHATLAKMDKEYNEIDGWGGNNEYTYLQMAPGTDLAKFNKTLTDLSIALKDKIGNERFVAEPIKDIHLLSNKSFEPEPNGSAKVVYVMLTIAIFIIVIAWVNYVNLSTARAIERAREVGIRKVMGSVRMQLVLQFLAESFMINIIAAIITFMIFQTGLPFFRHLTGQPLRLDLASDTSFWYIFTSLIVVGSLLSGLYPAFMLSSFQPSAVLKGKFRTSSHGQQLRKALVLFQFAATVILMAGMCAVYLQINYMRNYDLGLSLDQTLVVRANYDEPVDSISTMRQQTFKNELLKNTHVRKVASSGTVPGLSAHEMSTTSNVKRVGQDKAEGSYNYYHTGIDADFVSTLGIEFLAGRNFVAGAPNFDQVIINEEAATRLGFTSAEEAIGSKITFQTRWPGEPSTIIGVLKKYYQQSPKEQQIPMIFRYREGADYFSVKLSSNDMKTAVAEVKEAWDKVYPNTVFHYFFLDEQYNQQYETDMQFGQVIATFSGLAIIIACLGLFGLSAFTIVQRTKEIGIRKVLGASVIQIIHLLSKDFVKVVLIAAFVAIPVAYIGIQQWLSGYAVRISLSVWLFVLPVMIILLIALVTVSFQTIKTALSNPTRALKQE